MLILKTKYIAKTYKGLRDRGIIFDGKIKQEPYGKIVQFKDPDGYHWELVEEPKS